MKNNGEAYRCLIVDDEKSSREVIEAYVEKYCPKLQVCGKAENADEGIQLINKLKPHLVFLDIEMPFKSGFDLISAFEEPEFQVIFVTAYSDYALNAIQVSAADYLLKPVSISQLVEAVEKAIQRINNDQQINHAKILLDNLKLNQDQNQKVVLPILDGFEIVLAKDIIRCESDDNFTIFILENGERKMICRSLKFYESALEELGFLRIHKSHLVNLNHIKRYKKGKGGFVIMDDNSEVAVSQSRKSKLIEVFKG